MADINYQQPYEYQYQQPNAPYAQYGAQTPPPPYAYGYPQPQMRQKSVRDEFVAEHRKNGLVERLYNGIKNLTKLGIGSKKVEAVVKKAENGEISEEEARATIQRYRSSQANSAQIVGDAASIGASCATFFGLRKVLKTEAAAALLNEKYYKEIAEDLGKNGTKWTNRILNLAKSNTKMTLVLAGAAGLAGSFTKLWTGRINRIGSKEFKADKKDFNNLQTQQDRDAYKAYKKELKKAKRKQNRRNRWSGAINGLMMPITVLGGAIAGVPLYLAGNTLNRYFIGNTNEKNKSFKGYTDNLKQDGVLHGLLAAGMAIPLFMKGKFASVFDKNLKKSFEALKNANLKESGYEGKTVYKELEDILLESDSVKNVIDDSGNEFWEKVHARAKELQEKSKIPYQDAYKQALNEMGNRMDLTISALTKENIFAVKMKQISNDYTELTRALKENCPRTYTNEEASEIINKTFENKYKVTKSLGAGTVAETYLAETADGKQVCIKLLKKGITKEKILADEKKFIEIINTLSNKTPEEKEMLIKNIKNLSEGIQNEVNFEHEMQAAEKLRKHTQAAKVVKGIEVKDNIYVMEKADGISLETFAKINDLNHEIKWLKQQSGNWAIEKLAKSERELKNLKEKTPNWEEITELTSKEASKILDDYYRIKIEQFNKIGKDGKTIHADIHSGNIFFDVKAFKAGKKQYFTLIDTGNTIDMTKEQALRALKLTDIVEKGSTCDIAEYVLEGAELGASGLTKDEAVKKVTEELNKVFFDYETKLGPMTNDTVIDFCSNIMRKYKIVPNDNQLNINKAKTSAQNSYGELMDLLFYKKTSNLNENSGFAEKTGTATDLVATLLSKTVKYKQWEKMQEKANLVLLSPVERKKFKHNPNLLKTNDEKYLTYKLKQKMKFVEKKSNAEI